MRKVARFALCWTVMTAVFGQTGNTPGSQPSATDPNLPRMSQEQVDKLMKEEHQKAVQDAAELVKLSAALQDEIEKTDKYVLPMSAVRKTEDIERVARRLRGRLRRY